MKSAVRSYYAGKEEVHREREVLECGENRRFGILFSPEAPAAKKQNRKAAILAALQNHTLLQRLVRTLVARVTLRAC
jgi:hypothetical protein